MVRLSDYQMDAVKRLKNGSILCGGVGSGKSRTALAYYMFVVCKGMVPLNGGSDISPMKEPMDLYIITTARKRDTLEWQKECVPFLLYEEKDPIFNVKIVVDSWNAIGKYTEITNAFFIFDEQRVVGYGTWAKAFIVISRSNKWILLSATPGDTWMDYISVFVANGFYKNKTQFINEHVIYNRFAKYPKVDRYLGIAKLIRERDSILVNMDYQKKTVMNHIVLKVGYPSDIYNYVVTERWNIYKNEPCQDAGSLCQTLRRVVNECDERRIQMVDLIRNNPKLIVFYNFNYELEILRFICTNICRVPYSEWNGQKHEAIFTEKDKWVYLVQYSAGAEGWNCIDTNVIVFYSPNYSYKIATQAAGRIDRVNTPFVNLYCYHILSDSSIDRAIWNCLEKKKIFNESMFEPN